MKDYKNMKNFIHNDIKITKDEYKEIIREVVKIDTREIIDKEIKRELSKHNLENLISKVVKNELMKAMVKDTGYFVEQTFNNRIEKTVREIIGQTVLNNLDISVNLKKEE